MLKQSKLKYAFGFGSGSGSGFRSHLFSICWMAESVENLLADRSCIKSVLAIGKLAGFRMMFYSSTKINLPEFEVGKK